MACSSKGKAYFWDLKLLVDYAQQLEQFVKSDVRIGFADLSVSPESGQVQKLTLFSENFIRCYLKSIEDASSAHVAGILLLGY